MKYYVISSRNGYWLKKTGDSFPVQCIVSPHDSIEDAKKALSDLRAKREESRAIGREKWANKFDNAYEKGHFLELNRLCGIN